MHERISERTSGTLAGELKGEYKKTNHETIKCKLVDSIIDSKSNCCVMKRVFIVSLKCERRRAEERGRRMQSMHKHATLYVRWKFAFFQALRSESEVEKAINK
jgi:hypothetical protein